MPMGVETGNSLNVSASARPATPPTAHNKTIPTSSSRQYRFCMCSPLEGSLRGDGARSHFDMPTSTVSTTVSLTPLISPASGGAGCAASSIGVGALDRPDGGEISDPRRLCDLRAVHEPDRHIAAGVIPENVALAVAVEIARLDDRPSCGRRAEPHGQRELRTVPLPPGNIAVASTHE